MRAFLLILTACGRVGAGDIVREDQELGAILPPPELDCATSLLDGTPGNGQTRYIEREFSATSATYSPGEAWLGAFHLVVCPRPEVDEDSLFLCQVVGLEWPPELGSMVQCTQPD